jgi:uncharacterized membrane protein
VPPVAPVPQRHSELALAALAGGLSFTSSLLHRRPGQQAAVTVACVGLGAGAGLAVEQLVQTLAPRLGGERAARAALIAGGLLATGSRGQRSTNPGVALAATVGQVAGVGAALGWLTPPRPRYVVTPLDGLGLAALGLALREQAKRRKARRLTGRVFLRQYPAQRWLDTVSGGPGSLAPRATLDFEGTRFIGGVLPAEDIVALLGGGEAVDPIRVFVGVQTAPTPADRARIAVDELERLGAFDRGRILVCSPPLRGYVNPVPLKTHEALSRGDVASVTVQYYDRRTVLMPLKVPVAALTHRLVLEELHARLAGRSDAPTIEVYGESLGAWASQNVFLKGGLKALDALAVQRALWAGTPAFSRLRRWLASGQLESDERVAFVRVRDLFDLTTERRQLLRFLFLYRRVDPVVLFSGVDLLWRRPAWLDQDPGTRWHELRRVRWVPGVTFVQLTADLFRATNWTSATPQPVAHDYRIELPMAVNIAFGHHRDRAEIEPLADRIIAREVGALERLRALNHGQPDPGLPPLVGPRDPLGRADPTEGAAESEAAAAAHAGDDDGGFLRADARELAHLTRTQASRLRETAQTRGEDVRTRARRSASRVGASRVGRMASGLTRRARGHGAPADDREHPDPPND